MNCRIERYRVTGHASVSLNTVRGGNVQGQTIVFIHGLTHAHNVWEKQFISTLADNYRLIAYDLRGHGRSDRPEQGYEKSESWAGDLHAVIASAGSSGRVILVGWSYAGLVISDYVRIFGQESVAGIILSGASTRLDVPGRENDISESYKALVPRLGTEFLVEGVQAITDFVNLEVYNKLEPKDFYAFLGMAVSASPFARKGILQRKISNDDILGTLQVPVLLIHGEDDQIVLKTVSERHATLIPGAKTVYYPKTGHCAFWEQADQFNADVHRFASGL